MNNLPFSQECEEAVLATIMSYPDAIHHVSDILKPDDFYIEKHGQIYKAASLLERPDLVTVVNKLKENKSNVTPFDVANLAKSAVPSMASLEYNARIVAEKSMLRQMALTGSELQHAATDNGADPFEVAAELMTKIDVITGVIDQRQEVTAAQALARVTSSDTDHEPIYSGYDELDKELIGWVPGNVVVVAARPGMGKTTLALNLAAKFAQNHAVAFMSLEMPYGQIVHRLSQYYLKRSIHGNLSSLDVDQRIKLSNVPDMSRIVIDDTAAMDTRQMRAKITRYRRKHGIKVVIIDYLQLISANGSKLPREQQVSEVTRTLKHIAKDLGIVVVALSQLNRDVEKRPDKRPMLSDLRESGAIEQDADVVLMLYWEAYYNKENQEQSAFNNTSDGAYEVIIRKNRHGRCCTVPMVYRPAWSRIDPSY